jgi:hypothetical protein
MAESLWQKRLESVLAALAIVVCIVFSAVLRFWYNRWGASTDEVLRLLPGDERVRRPRLGYTRAITIRTHPAQIWPWLVQMGQERGGLYSYEPLENIIGCHMKNADVIVPEWQHLHIDDTLRLGPKGYPLFKIVAVEPGKSVVFAAADLVTEQITEISHPMPEEYVNYSWGFYLKPLDDSKTRLIVRARLDYQPRQFINWLLWRVFMEPINFVMERKTLLGIRTRAEGTLVKREESGLSAKLVRER